MENNYKIYHLSSSEKPDEIRYIGYTGKKLKSRLSTHIKDSRYKPNNNHRVNWIRKVLKDGYNVNITLIEDNINKIDIAHKKEIYFIKKYRDLGIRLTNSTDGGEGTTGYKFTSKDRKRLASNNIKSVLQFDSNGNLIKEWKSISIAYRTTGIGVASISSVCRGRYITAGGYIWRYSGDDFKKYRVNKRSNTQRGTPGKIICKYSLNGEFIMKYESLSIAARKNNIYAGNIRKSANGKKMTANGYVWRYGGESFNKYGVREYNVNNFKKKPICKYSLSGEFIKEYESVCLAVKESGVHKPGMLGCANGRRKTAGGFKWKYKKDVS